MRSHRTLAILVITVMLSSCSSLPCSRPPRPAASASDLQPGRYEIVLKATQGSHSGAVARGQLWLRRTTSQDRADTPLYGWVQIDFTAVGAPVFAGGGPPPTSSDPSSPGVLVRVNGWKEKYAPGTPVLTVGTDSNRNPIVSREPGGAEIIETLTDDGSGIGLWVHEVREGEFVGRWSEWGIVRDGRGFFCATRVGDTE